MKWFPISYVKVSKNVLPFLIMPEKNEKWRRGSPMGVQKWPKMAKLSSTFFSNKIHRQSPLGIVFMGEMVSTDTTALVMVGGDEGSHMGGQQMGQKG